MPAYELRSGGDVKNKKQSVADLKYRRLTELNARLKEDLDRPRVKVSEAALSSVNHFFVLFELNTDPLNSLISYCNNTRDFMVPSVWGQVCDRVFSMACARI
jgi:guanine nucleotide-binding protein subunit gamma